MTDPIKQQKAAELVRSKIRAAFPDSVYSGPITGVDGVQNEVLDEQQALYEELHGKKWSDIQAQFVASYPDGTALLTEQAFIVFLPAWLIAALGDDEVRELVVYSFSPIPGKPSDRWDNRMRQLNQVQLEALHAFLKYCLDIESSEFVKGHAQNAIAYVERFVGS